MLQVSARGRDFIASHEGCATSAYRCPAGVLTIGFGHTSAAGSPKVTAGMTITRAQALTILAADLPKYSANVNRKMGNTPQHVLDGATSFDFNTGAVGSGKASWVKKFLAGDLTKAEASLKEWKKGGGKILKGLVRRRAEEANIIFRNVWSRITTTAHISTTRAEIAAYQEVLKMLGYYAGNVDGIAGELTNGAVVNFQRANPPLVVDGIVGPATRATMQRDLDAKRGNQASGAGGGLSSAGAAATDAGDKITDTTGAVDPAALAEINLWLVLAIGLVVAAAVWGGFWLWRNRGRLTGQRVPT